MRLMKATVRLPIDCERAWAYQEAERAMRNLAKRNGAVMLADTVLLDSETAIGFRISEVDHSKTEVAENDPDAVVIERVMEFSCLAE